MRVLGIIGKEIVRRLFVAFLIWLVISASYGASGTPVESSVLYNSPEIETKAVLIYIPIISVTLSVVLRILFPHLDKEIFMSWDERIRRRIRRTEVEVGREMQESKK